MPHKNFNARTLVNCAERPGQRDESVANALFIDRAWVTFVFVVYVVSVFRGFFA